MLSHPFRRRLMAIAAIGALIFGCATSGVAQTAKRVALVIGNADYAHAPALEKADQSARDVGAALERLGFEVTRTINADLETLRAGVSTFQRNAATADAALVFYSGYALRYRGGGYLVPVDATLQDDASIEWGTLQVLQVLGALSRARSSFLIVDGCGVSQLESPLQRLGGRATPGLGEVASRADMLIAASAAQSAEACSGAGANVFSTSLLAEIEQPGTDAATLFQRLRQIVNYRSGGAQTLEVTAALSRDFVFARGDSAEAAFRQLGVEPDLANLRAYLERHANHPLAAAVKTMLAQREQRPAAGRNADSWRGLVDGAWNQERQGQARIARLEALEARWSRDNNDRETERAAAERRRQTEAAAAEQRRLEQERLAREQAEREEQARIARERDEERKRQAEIAAAEERRKAEAIAADQRIQAEIAAEYRRQTEAAAAEQRRLGEAAAAEQRRLAQAAAAEQRRIEQERLAREQAEREERARIARERDEERKRQAEAAAAEQRRTEPERLAREREERARIVREQEEERRRQAEAAVAEQRRAEQERLAREQAEREQRARLAREQEEERRRQAEAAAQRRRAEEQRLALAIAPPTTRPADSQPTVAPLTTPQPAVSQPATPTSVPVAGAAVDEASRFSAEQRRLAQERIDRERRARGAPDEFAAPLPSETAPSPASTPAAPTNTQIAALPPADTPDLIKSAQDELKRLGCYAGVIHGRMNSGTRTALDEAGKKLGVTASLQPLTEDAVRALRDQRGPLCQPGAAPKREEADAPARPSKRSLRPKVSSKPAEPAAQRRVIRERPAARSGGGGSRCFSFGGNNYCE